MATFRVEHRHALPAEEAVRRVKEVLEQRVGGRAEVVWDGHNASFSGSGFSGSATIDEGFVSVDVDLSFLLRPMRGTIETKLTEALQRGLA
jgi:putative polyhydroxyalkanoate system protein